MQKSESVLKMNQEKMINALDDETERLWKIAKDQNLWLEGDRTNVDGRDVDWSMLDFAIATTSFRSKDQQSMLTLLQRVWWSLTPHIDTVLDQLKNYETQFKTVMGIEDKTLKSYALQHLELACYQKFFDEELAKYMSGTQAKKLKAEFHNFHTEYEEESQRKIAEIKERENKRKINEEEVIKEEKLRRERIAFERSLK